MDFELNANEESEKTGTDGTGLYLNMGVREVYISDFEVYKFSSGNIKISAVCQSFCDTVGDGGVAYKGIAGGGKAIGSLGKVGISFPINFSDPEGKAKYQREVSEIATACGKLDEVKAITSSVDGDMEAKVTAHLLAVLKIIKGVKFAAIIKGVQNKNGFVDLYFKGFKNAPIQVKRLDRVVKIEVVEDDFRTKTHKFNFTYKDSNGVNIPTVVFDTSDPANGKYCYEENEEFKKSELEKANSDEGRFGPPASTEVPKPIPSDDLPF